jgi:ATP-dependent DNA helicase PIF1
VVKNGTRAQIVNSSLRNASFWSSVNQFRLSVNMRVERDVDVDGGNNVDSQEDFVRFLLQVGDGLASGKRGVPDSMLIPEDMVLHGTIKDLIRWTYPSLHENFNNHEYITNRAILTTKNVDADEANAKMLSSFPGEVVVYKSADSVFATDNAVSFPTEFLNSLSLPGLPPHELCLKKGACIMLLRNIDAPNGLCNGTRLIIQNLRPNVIEAVIVTGSNVGHTVSLSKLPLMSAEDATIPFAMKRVQFPIRLAFALTINNSQGQTIPTVGLYLREPCFAHGQLYVAFSRVKSRKNIKVLVVEDQKPQHQQVNQNAINNIVN